jgi:hypothetical protein
MTSRVECLIKLSILFAWGRVPCFNLLFPSHFGIQNYSQIYCPLLYWKTTGFIFLAYTDRTLHLLVLKLKLDEVNQIARSYHHAWERRFRSWSWYCDLRNEVCLATSSNVFVLVVRLTCACSRAQHCSTVSGYCILLAILCWFQMSKYF